MVEKIRKIVFFISIFYSIVILILMFLAYNNATTTIYLEDFHEKENKIKLESYKNELKTFKQNECINILNDMINYYDETTYNGNVELKKLYGDINNDNNFLSYYSKLKTLCYLNDQFINDKNLEQKFISASFQNDEWFTRYYFQYELSLRDVTSRKMIEPSLSKYEYMINRTMQLEIIDNVINELKEESINE